MGFDKSGEPVMNDDMKRQENQYLQPTSILDSNHPAIIEYAMESVRGVADDPVEKAVALYYRVRDPIWYDPYVPFYKPEHYRTSAVLQSGRGYCVSKAGLLCALGRACNIPSRIGFANVQNHLATKQLVEIMGTDRFVYHGYTELYLEGKWIKATPAFNVELCEKHRVHPLEFNGREDSIFHEFAVNDKPFMEYLEDLGTRPDIPVDEIVAGWKAAYGEERVLAWIDAFETNEGKSRGDFFTEDVL